MRNLVLITITLVLGFIITGCNSTKPSCSCKICTLCDSLEEACYTDSFTIIKDAEGKTVALPLHSTKFNLYYDSLTNIVAGDIAYHYEVCDSAQFIDYVFNEYCGNKKFMQQMDEGFDGLCGDVYTEYPDAIDKFYDLLDDYKTLHK